VKARIASVLGVTAALAVTGLVLARTGTTLRGALHLLPLQAHLLAALAIGVHLGARALRIRLVAGWSGSTLRLRTALHAVLVGDAAAAVTPARAGSDPAKLVVLTRAGEPMPTVGAVLVGEMLAEVAALTLVCLGAALLLPGFRGAALGALLYAAVVLTTISTLLLIGRGAQDRPLPRWLGRLRLSDRRWRGLRLTAGRFYSRTMQLRGMRPHRYMALLAVSLMHMAARLAVLPVLALAVAPDAPLAALISWPLLLLYAGAVMPPPAGGGTIEIAFAAALGGVLPEHGVGGLLLWWRFYTFYLSALLGGLAAAALPGVGRRQSGSGARAGRGLRVEPH
jgi:glycosyltransferase 2 family protein